MSAVLLADACNIGLRAVAHSTLRALSADRLAWVRQNYLRSQSTVDVLAAMAASGVAADPADLPGLPRRLNVTGTTAR